jgi:hypothetical protein
MDELQQRRERHADEDATAAGGKVVRLAQRDRDAHRQDDVADVRDLEAKAADHDADVRDRSAERRDAAAAARDAGWVQWLGSLSSISTSMVCSRLPMPVAPQRKLTKQVSGVLIERSSTDLAKDHAMAVGYIRSDTFTGVAYPTPQDATEHQDHALGLDARLP